MLNKCPKPGCELLKPRGQYACRKHWLGLPAGLRQRLWRGYRSSITLWFQADKEAIEYWRAAEEQSQSSME